MRIEGSRQAAIKPEMLEMLKNLEVGDTLKGRVLEAIGSSIAIRTAGGQIFTAMLQESASIPKGAFVELVVSGLSDGKIYAEFKAESRDTSMDTKVSQLLGQLNLPSDEKNMEAAKLLIKYNMPVEKEAIINITVLQKSIENLNRSSEGRIGLMLSGMDIKNTPVDVLNKIVLTWSPDMIKTETDTPAAAVDEVEDGKTAELPANVKANAYAASSEEEIKIKISGSKEEISGIKRSADTGVVEEKAAVVRIMSLEGESEENTVQEAAAVKSGSGAELINMLKRLGIETDNEVKSFAGQVETILSAVKNADMESVAYLISKDMDATPRNLGMLVRNIENRDGISQFLDKLQQRLEVKNDPKLQELKESIRKVFLEPRQVEDPEEVKEQIKDIAKLGERLENFMESGGRRDPEIREALSNLRDSLDFIRNINEFSNFMQLPVMINSDATTAKLYVFKEGKSRKAIDPENATILLALDLNSLGHLESMIGIKGRSVNVTFRVEKDSIGTLIEKSGHILKKSLEEKGYNLSPVKIISLEQPFSLLSLEEIINSGSSSKIHFDARV